MLINCYYYAPHNHSLLRRHLRDDLRHMADLGCDAVSICVQEDQLTNWHQARLLTVLDEAHAVGLQVHAVPNRWCGLVAGWLDGYSRWTLTHRETFLPAHAERGFSDPSHPAVREHYQTYLEKLVEAGFDGVIWDEPRPAESSVIGFLDDMSAYVKSLNADIVVSIFAEANDLHLASDFASASHFDFAGADGHVRRPAYQMHRMKNTIFDTYPVFSAAMSETGKKTMFLLEAQRHRDEDLAHYLACMDAAFELPMDHLMFYYSGHEMRDAKNEASFNEATWSKIRSLSTRR